MSKKPILRHLAISCLVALILIATAPQSALAQSPASSTGGTLPVERHGNRGRAVILIPGLESGAWVWRRTIANLQKDDVVYAVTLAGCDGVSAPLWPGLKHANAPDFSQLPMMMCEAQKTAYDESPLANAPDAKVVSISPARHFVMLDQPAGFRQTLNDFLTSL